MRAFDLFILSFFSQFAHLSGALNRFVFDLEETNLFTWVPMTALLWWAWFRNDGREENNRKVVVSSIVALVFVILIFCLLRHAGPWIEFRPRPMFDPQCNFRMPYGLNTPNPASYWGRSNTFPSGHAAIFAVFTVGLMYVSRLAGVLCLVYSLLICSIRIFFGIHYPTDIIGGACIGVGTAYLARTRIVEYLSTRRMMRWSDLHPSSFYAGFFVIAYIVATGFDQLKEITDPVRDLMRILWH